MSETTLPHPAPPPEDLSPRQAQDLSTRLQAAVGTGSVRETPRVDGLLDRLDIASQPPSQSQRDVARQVTSVFTPNDVQPRSAEKAAARLTL